MTDFQRNTGEVGEWELIGVRDPGNRFLDDAGNFVGEISYLISGLGDTVNLAADFILPIGDPLRGIGEGIFGVGEDLGDTQVRPRLGMVSEPNELAIWQLNPGEGGRFNFKSQQVGLVLDPRENGLTLSSPAKASANSEFRMIPAEGCAEFPQAELNATVSDEGPANYLHEVDRYQGISGLDQDDVYGYVDTHSHISAYEFIGGRINYGDPFHRFGVSHAVKDCSVNHGPQGMTGLLEQATGVPGPHDTQGWPSFNDWPRRDSLMHHQSYYRWLERAHLGGMKLIVNHLVHNEILCQINPQKQNDCDPNESIELQIQRMYEMQDYIDAQAGGPGKGFFQIVTNPEEAREVIDNGKLAVVLGIEMSHPFGCQEFNGIPQCSRDQILEDLDRFHELGVRTMFPTHKFDNAFAGHLPDLSSGIGVGPVLAAGNLLSTGHPIEYESCPGHVHDDNESGQDEYTGTEPDQNPNLMNPMGMIEQLLFQLDYAGDRFPQAPEQLAEYDLRRGTDHLCNRRGLSDLGDFLIEELMRRGMMIETDHISRKAAARILEITGEQDYPVINSHGSWGGTSALRDRIAEQGGITADFGKTRGGWVDSLLKNANRPHPEDTMIGPFAGAGFASDVNGIASLPANTNDAESSLYPFKSVDGRVTFDVQTTGDREFSLYDGRGVAHYGLYPDQLADMIQNADRPPEAVNRAVDELFVSAEAYLRMWERTEAAVR
ncbi:membrane dipeptidase [uncultured Halovibrio sp.]|uniref:membrane dipeptidase n=1 Tax=uncultured Halovibrio sp. TaxID=985049 RepID=UPI0025CC7D08|nr:membrane dipeptidase [uncultured Halovibrio sp.]